MHDNYTDDLLEPEDIDLDEVFPTETSSPGQTQDGLDDLDSLIDAAVKGAGAHPLAHTFEFDDKDRMIEIFNASLGYMAGTDAIVDASIDGGKRYAVMSVTAARNLYKNRKLFLKQDTKGRSGSKKKTAKDTVKVVSAFDTWLESPDRRTINKIKFEAPPYQDKIQPERFINGGTALNTWMGFAVQPKQGDTSPFWSHVEEVLCDGDRESFEYVRRWIYKSLQYPTRPIGAALVFTGPPNAGKSIVAKGFKRLFNENNAVTITSMKEIVGDFNAVMESKSFIYADEVKPVGSQERSMLKTALTDDEVRINPKGVNAYTAQTGLSMMISSNHKIAVAVERGDRRFAVFDVSGKYIDNKVYFDALGAWFVNDLGTLLYEALYEVEDYGDWNASSAAEIPKTRARNEQILATLEHYEQALVAVAEEARIPFLKKHPDGSVRVQTNMLAQFINRDNDRNLTSAKSLAGVMARLGYPKKKSGSVRYYLVPEPKVFAYDLSQLFGLKVTPVNDEWDNDRKTMMLGHL